MTCTNKSFHCPPVEHASLRSNGFLKPNPYVEISIDNKSSRKTDFLKNTNAPKWNERFTVIVSANSLLHFRVLDHSSFRKDSVLGQQTVYLANILEHYNGVLENLELSMDLLSDGSGSKVNEPRQPAKTGELVAVLNGLKIDMRTVALRSGSGGASGLNTSGSGSIHSNDVAAVALINGNGVSVGVGVYVFCLSRLHE